MRLGLVEHRRADPRRRRFPAEVRVSKAFAGSSRSSKHKAIRGRAVMNRSIIGPVPLLFAGPPWRVDFYSDKGLDRTPDLRYPDTADDEISLWQGCV